MAADNESDFTSESWIEWFCRQRGHQFLCEVEASFIEDQFNLYGLRSVVPKFRACLQMILDEATADESEPEEWTGPMYAHCKDLYGLIHARYILTARGMTAMLCKLQQREFGECPLLGCHGRPVLPVGLHSEPGSSLAHVYCPRCKNVYRPGTPSAGSSRTVACEVDSAFIGPTFPHLFYLTYPSLADLPSPDTYSPTVFGFRIYDGRFGKPGSLPSATQPGGNSKGGAVVKAPPPDKEERPKP